MKYQFINLAVIMSLGMLVSGCNWGDDDDETPIPNRAPNALSEDLTTQADVVIVGQVTATDEDGDMLTYSLTSEPQLGSITLAADGAFTYTPNSTVTGQDSFAFTASDGSLVSNAGTIGITIENQVVSFASYSRDAFSQDEQDTPLPINGREFTQDVSDPNAYDDLIINP
ncbi:Ig-like domain-containing protein [Aliiglaciecola litoralis]|uniref:Cadherin-like domain-containing protein n=1 Tax=Aliiglaciecola litoralis TaxID=582857 RepID=A0ABN1LDP0_9ALTE